MYHLLFKGKEFFITLVGTFIAGSIAMMTQRAFGTAYWTYFAFAVGYGAAVWILGGTLMGIYIARRTGGVDTSEVAPGVQAWELTAGKGIVPRWVNRLQLSGFYFLFAIPFELFTRMLR